LARRPKASLLDAALSAALTGFTTDKAVPLGGREYFGLLLEQFVALELSKQRAWTRTPFTVFHLRELDGLEVDLLLETDDGTLIAIEGGFSPASADSTTGAPQAEAVQPEQPAPTR